MKLLKKFTWSVIWDELKDRCTIMHTVYLVDSNSACIARLAIEPDVILMDEPTSALDQFQH